MPRPAVTNDLAFELFARWEDEQARGATVSLEEACAGHPDLLPAVREIAGGLAAVASFFAPAPARAVDPAISPAEAVSWLPTGWQEVDRGASSIVYRGEDPTLGTMMAFKVLHPRGPLLLPADNDRLMKRFEQEARILARLKHEGIVRIFKTFGLNGRSVLEMEYLPGGSLVTHLKAVRARGAVGIASFLERVARAVGFAHDHGIVHRDLKPSNILLDTAGRPCVSDFGVAKLLHLGEFDEPTGTPADETSLEAGLTAVGRQPGTKAYMAPEQFDPAFGEISPATDVWALGVILYELLTGMRPFTGGTAVEWKTAVCEGRLPSRRWSRWRWKGRLERIALRCLARSPTRRYASAAALAAALAEVTRPRWRKPTLAGGVLFLVLAAAAGGAAVNRRAWNASHSQEEGSEETLQEVEAEIARAGSDQPVTLIPEAGKPKSFRWKTGRDTSQAITNPDEYFQVESNSVALMELVSDPQTDRFQIDAYVKHTRNLGGIASVGLYVGRKLIYDYKDVHSFAQITFDDTSRPPKVEVIRPDGGHRTLIPARQLEMRPRLLSEPNRPPDVDILMAGKVGPNFEANPRGDWHHVRVIVSPDELIAEWDGQQLRLPVPVWESSVANAISHLQASRMLSDKEFVRNLQPKFAPRGGLGLCVMRASAAFSQITVTRKDK